MFLGPIHSQRNRTGNAHYGHESQIFYYSVVPMRKTNKQNPVRVLQMSQEAAGDSLFDTPGRSWKADHTEAGKSPRSHRQLDPRESCSLTTLLAVTSERDTATCTNWERQEARCYQGCQHIQHPASSCDSFQCFRRVNAVAKWGEDKNILLSPQRNSCLRGSSDSRVGKQHAQQRGKSPVNHLLWDYPQITHWPSLISYREVS